MLKNGVCFLWTFYPFNLSAGNCCVSNEWLNLYQKFQILCHRSGLFRALYYPLLIDSFSFSYECIWLFNLRLPFAIFFLYSHCHQPSQSPYQFISWVTSVLQFFLIDFFQTWVLNGTPRVDDLILLI